MRAEPHTPLARLAAAAGVAVRYEVEGAPVAAPDDTVRAVLAALGHPCDDDAQADASLRALRHRPWVRAVDPVAVQWQDAPAPTRVTFSVAGGAAPELTLTLEDGTDRALPPPVRGGLRTFEDGARRRATVALPTDLPLGYHDLAVTTAAGAVGHCTVIVAPANAPRPGPRRVWGWMVQAYALRSAESWGHGEFRDIGNLAAWSAEHGAEFVLINPVHAPAPALPQQASPYSPSSRRFVNPCYLHLPEVPEYAALPEHERARLGALPAALDPHSAVIDRDGVWQVKRAALQRAFDAMDADGRARLDAYRRDRGASLERFATFCALAEVHGLPFDEWPDGLRDPRRPEVASWAREHADRVALHAWLQQLCDAQLHAAQQRADDAGMTIGVIHDLAVGVEGAGADVWALPEEICREMTVGAPPDAFNQQGQNWGQPPLLPEGLRANGYRALRELLRASLRAGGGLRIDHILGLSRLFWIPRGADASAGTYVRYPAEEMFAVLALEAQRSGGIVVGEDLGTIDDRIRVLMRRRGVASSAVLYFEAGDGGRRPAATYPAHALASVTTHDLPTATGFWDGSALQVRAGLGLLPGGLEAERQRVAEERRSMLELLVAHGCLPDAGAGVRERVLAMHRFLAGTPTRLVAGALWDALGDPRQPNVPGTVDEYPNWRLPLSAPDGDGPRPVTLEEIERSSAVAETIEALRR